MKKIEGNLMKELLKAQKNEITEYNIYCRLAEKTKDPHNGGVLKNIGEEEKAHYKVLKKYTETEIKPDKLKVIFFYWICRIFGLTFGVKLMEKGEQRASSNYKALSSEIPELKKIMDDEDAHEMELINIIREERLEYAGSVVLGLNDALVELTGTLAGLTFALQNGRLTALAGLITGIAASFSMAASQYLSEKTEGSKNAFKSSLYTGVAYIITVCFLIFPYLALPNYFIALIVTMATAILIIFLFNFYISVAKDYDFKTRFFEMAAISLGVAFISFAIGYLVRMFFGVDI